MLSCDNVCLSVVLIKVFLFVGLSLGGFRCRGKRVVFSEVMMWLSV